MNAPIKVTDFAKDLAESHSATFSPVVWDAIKRHFPSALKAHQCHVENDKRGADVIVELMGEKPVMVDLKTRKKDYAKNRSDIDVVIELTYGNKPGWANKETLADYYLYVCMDTGRSACFPAKELQEAAARHSSTWCDSFKHFVTHTASYYGATCSQAVVVPAHVVAEAIQQINWGA